MDAIEKFGFAVLAGAALLAFSTGAAAAVVVAVTARSEPERAVVPVHGCHMGCVKTGPGSAHRHVGAACRWVSCGWQPSPRPRRR